MNQSMKDWLKLSAAQHNHLCPKQVLGVRMGMFAGTLLQIPLPQSDKRLYAIVETDGCTLDGISAVTGCTPGHRTLRVEDYGKVAATFIDSVSRLAFRIVPHPEIRKFAHDYAPAGSSKWEAYLIGYQNMPDELLLAFRPVVLSVPIEKLVSRPGLKAICSRCGEEVINGREAIAGGRPVCKPCSGESYYEPAFVDSESDLSLCHRP